jgi:hypothetical protein
MPLKASKTYAPLPETILKNSRETGLDNTQSGSTTNGAYVLSGE